METNFSAATPNGPHQGIVVFDLLIPDGMRTQAKIEEGIEIQGRVIGFIFLDCLDNGQVAPLVRSISPDHGREHTSAWCIQSFEDHLIRARQLVGSCRY